MNAIQSAAWTREQRQLGRDRYYAGEQITECQNAEQRRGWWNALNAAADATTYAYLSNGAKVQA